MEEEGEGEGGIEIGLGISRKSSLISPPIVTPTSADGFGNRFERMNIVGGEERNGKEGNWNGASRIGFGQEEAELGNKEEMNHEQSIELRFTRDTKGRLHNKTLLGEGRHGVVYLASYRFKRQRLRSVDLGGEDGHGDVVDLDQDDEGGGRGGGERDGEGEDEEGEDWRTCAAKVFDPDSGGMNEARKEAGMLRYLHGGRDPIGGMLDDYDQEGEWRKRFLVGYVGLSTTIERDAGRNGSEDSPVYSDRDIVIVGAGGGVGGDNRRSSAGLVHATRQRGISISSLASTSEDHSSRRSSLSTSSYPEFYSQPSPKTHSVLLLEYCPNGTVERFLAVNFRHMNRELWRRWYAQGEAGLRWCHMRNVVHCDVKPGNLLVSRWAVFK